jgi:hypothetical protein
MDDTVNIWLDDNMDFIIWLDDYMDVIIWLDDTVKIWLDDNIDVIIWLDDNVILWMITFIIIENVTHSSDFGLGSCQCNYEISTNFS